MRGELPGERDGLFFVARRRRSRAAVHGYGGGGLAVQIAIDAHLPNILALAYGQASAAGSACAMLGHAGGGTGIYAPDGSIDTGGACTEVAHDAVGRAQATVGGAAQAGASVAAACGAAGGGGGYGGSGGPTEGAVATDPLAADASRPATRGVALSGTGADASIPGDTRPLKVIRDS